MTNKILIIIGASTILLMLGAWIYLFVFGTPDSVGQALNNLSSPETPFEQPIVGSLDTTVALGDKNLAQLTTRPVAGFVLINTTSQPTVRYAEKGTGHVYEINLTNGTEERIDGTTSANTTEAYFNEEGTEAVLVSVDNQERVVVWRTSVGSAGSTILPNNSYDFAWGSEDSLRYTEKTSEGKVAYEASKDSRTELWRVPMADLRVMFTATTALLINNPAANLAGSLYEIQNNSLTTIVGPAYAFTATPDPAGQYVLYRYFDTEKQTTVAKVRDVYTNEETISPLPAIPEKCVFSPVRLRVWCASSFMLLGTDRGYLNKWYRGEAISEDKIWVSDYENWGVASIEVDLLEVAGFNIDVVDMTVSDDGTMLLFRNKINDALWMYRLSGNNETTEVEPVGNTGTTSATSDVF